MTEETTTACSEWCTLRRGLLCFAFIGMFRSLLAKPSRRIRYVSDASYWLYLAHLPLIMLAQWAVRDWLAPSLVKFVLVCVVVTGFLLLTYQFMVRYTWIGRLLNGPRQRPGSQPQPLPLASV